MSYHKRDLRDFPGGPGVRLHTPKAGGPDLILGHMPQTTTKNLNATTKTPHA